MTSDSVPTDLLRTETIRRLRAYAEDDFNFKSQFCKVTTKTTVDVLQRTMTFDRAGRDTSYADFETRDKQSVSLAEPKRWNRAIGFTQVAIDEGMTAEDFRGDRQELMDAHQRLITQCCLSAMLTDGGFWAGAAIPPRYESNSFLVTHDHYLAHNVAGVPTLAICNEMKHHITEHGFKTPTLWMNSGTAEQIENIAEWGTAPGPMPTSLLDTLQKLGLTPSFQASGMAVIVNDWIPEEYLLAVDPTVKPLYWRSPVGDPTSKLHVTDYPPDEAYYSRQSVYQWTSATVGIRGAGVATYLGGAAYTDPTWEYTF